jgi:hypothetical protein
MRERVMSVIISKKKNYPKNTMIYGIYAAFSEPK